MGDTRLFLAKCGDGRKGVWADDGHKTTCRGLAVRQVSREVTVAVGDEATLRRVVADEGLKYEVLGREKVAHEAVQPLVTSSVPSCDFTCKHADRKEQVVSANSCNVQDLHDDLGGNRCEIALLSPVIRGEGVLVE